MRSAGATEPGAENLDRLRSRLRRSPAALAELRRLGVSGSTADRYHLGLRDAYTSRTTGSVTADAIAFPILGSLGRPLGKYANLALQGVTRNPPHPVGWCAGRPLSYWGAPATAGCDVIVSGRILSLWRLGGLPGAHPRPLALLAPSHPDEVPSDWRDPRFWSGFGRVILIDQAGECDAFVTALGRACSRPMARIAAPMPAEGSRSLAGDRIDQEAFDRLVRDAPAWFPAAPVPVATVAAENLGDFQADPLPVAGAYKDGNLYYPFEIEERSLAAGAAEGEAQLVQAYRTRVLRSDGATLTLGRLPSPAGTPAHRKVLALSDGTRVAGGLDASRLASWRHPSIREFITWRRGEGAQPFRDAAAILTDIGSSIEARVWLADPDDRAAVALYVLVTHVYQVFAAIPVLAVVGPAATGKSDLGEAIAELGFNGVVAGRISGAALIRLIEEARGVVVLDDAGPGSTTGRAGEVGQVLASGYKRATARKIVADRGGRVRTIDYFGPRVITTVDELDPVLASRALVVRAGPAEGGFAGWRAGGGRPAADIRDEIHCWSMANASAVSEAYAGAMATVTDRRGEAFAPFRAVARVVGSETLAAVARIASRG